MLTTKERLAAFTDEIKLKTHAGRKLARFCDCLMVAGAVGAG